jgi:NADH:ubiquinone oxidoreductase subunit 2 (subunit N)
VLFDAGRRYADAGSPGLGYTMYALLVVGGLNTAISAVYYIRVLKVMVLDRSVEEVEGQPPAPLPLPAGRAAYATILAVAVVALGVFWNAVTRASDRGVDRFQRVPSAGGQLAQEGVRP